MVLQICVKINMKVVYEFKRSMVHGLYLSKTNYISKIFLFLIPQKHTSIMLSWKTLNIVFNLLILTYPDISSDFDMLLWCIISVCHDL